MERRSPHRIVRSPRYTDQVLSPYLVTARPTTDLVPGYWRLVTIKMGLVQVRQYPHMEHDRALAHFGWLVTRYREESSYYVSLENASGQLVDEFERRAGEDFTPPGQAHRIVHPSRPHPFAEVI